MEDRTENVSVIGSSVKVAPSATRYSLTNWLTSYRLIASDCIQETRRLISVACAHRFDAAACLNHIIFFLETGDTNCRLAKHFNNFHLNTLIDALKLIVIEFELFYHKIPALHHGA